MRGFRATSRGARGRRGPPKRASRGSGGGAPVGWGRGEATVGWFNERRRWGGSVHGSSGPPPQAAGDDAHQSAQLGDLEVVLREPRPPPFGYGARGRCSCWCDFSRVHADGMRHGRARGRNLCRGVVPGALARAEQATLARRASPTRDPTLRRKPAHAHARAGVHPSRPPR